MTTRSRSALRRSRTARFTATALLATGLTGLAASPASAAPTCVLDGGTGVATVTMDTTTAAVAPGGSPIDDPFQVDGVDCVRAPATVAVLGTSGDDTVTLDLRNQLTTHNLLAAGKAEVTVDLAGGNDSLVVLGSAFADTFVSTASGFSLSSRFQDVTLTGVEAVTFDLKAGDDTLDLSADTGYAVRTTVQPGDGLDTLTGGAGNDTFVATPAGADTDAEADSFTGGAGADTVDYSVRAATVTVDPGTGGGSGESGEADTVAADVENASTGDGDDTIYGTAADQTIRTGDGNDSVYPMGGDDAVDVGSGGDVVDCGSAPDGADTFTGTADAMLDYTGRANPLTLNLALGDNLGEAGEGDTQAGFGIIRGGQGNDVITGTGFTELLYGGPGNDTLNGGGGPDELLGGPGNDILDGGPGADLLHGEENNDALVGGAGNDELDAGPGNDTFPQGTAADGTDLLSGGDGVDLVSYAQRTTPVGVVLGGTGGSIGEADTIGADVENVAGGSANDLLVGNALGNALLGNGGNDTLRGGPGPDVESGGPGNDVFDQVARANGADSLSGGAGVDRVDYTTRTRAVVVTLDNGPNDGASGEKDNVRTDVENVRGGAAADVLSGSAAANVLEGFGGADVLDGLAGRDTLACGAGRDRAVRRTGDRYTGCESVR